MRRAGGLSPGPEKQSSLRMHPRDLHHPQAAGSHRPSPPPRLGIQSCWPPPARARHVVFEDELMPLGRPSRRVPTDKESKKSVPPTLAPRPCTLPDYVVRYPAIRSPRQREGYKGVFQDQLAEYTELLGQVRATWHGLGAQEAARPGRTPPEGSRGPLSAPQGKTKVAHVWQEHGRKKRDATLPERQQRCRYLKLKLTHIKARIQEFDRDGGAATAPRGRRTPGQAPQELGAGSGLGVL
ncbi:occludin/ELL domain-containing protein 1 isoform X3 [Pogoniulus pusillus]|uniref:occludin/ELL domain-containing protein 1 isoform X3 n=1 Tax=Pogoniulus pusillus TaxID=488313 RepID=UPI0030B99A67